MAGDGFHRDVAYTTFLSPRVVYIMSVNSAKKDKPFEPPWEGDREELFASFDYSLIPTPAYVIHLGALEENLVILQSIKRRTGCRILLALKGFAAWKTFSLVSKYLDGVCASSVYEARLGFEQFGGEVCSYCPAYSEGDIQEHLHYSNTIIFNSFSQWMRYRETIACHNARNPAQIRCGMRLYQRLGKGVPAIYNPCVAGARLGSPLKKWEQHSGDLDGISVAHFHLLCEEGADALERALEAVEGQFAGFFHRMEEVNFGGGHHITRKGYDVELLCRLIEGFKERYGVEVVLEPGEAIALNAGVLVSTVLDIIENDGLIALLDTSAEAHMPDVLAMPYRPAVVGGAQAGVKPHTYRLAGVTCLAGDVIGSYSFDIPLQVGDKVVFQNMVTYTSVKNTFFNGIKLPNIILIDTDGTIQHRKAFAYEDYKNRLS